MINRRKLFESNDKDPKAKVRNRGDVVFPAESSLVKDDKDHFPINSESQARNALARASQYKSAPDWFKGSLKKLVTTVASKVHKKYPSIDITEAGKTPGKQTNESLNESRRDDATEKLETMKELLGVDKLFDEICTYFSADDINDALDYIAKQYNIENELPGYYETIIDYLKNNYDWDDLDDDEIIEIGDIINNESEEKAIELIKKYLNDIGNTNHYPATMIREFNIALSKADDTETSEALNELDSRTYVNAANKALKLGQHDRFQKFNDQADIQFNKETEKNKNDKSEITIYHDGFDLYMLDGNGTGYNSIMYNLNTDEMFADDIEGEEVIFEPGDEELKTADRNIIRKILYYFNKYNPTSKYNDKSIWIA